MLKEIVEYEDLNGDIRRDILMFNLSKMDIIEMEAENVVERLSIISKSDNAPEILSHFKEFVHRAYGVKSDDGKRFIKSPEILEEFIDSSAYDEFLFALMTDAHRAAKFIRELFPEKLLDQVRKGMEKAQEQSKDLDKITAQYFSTEKNSDGNK